MRAAGALERLGRRLDVGSDAGQMGGVEVLPFGLLIFVAGSLMVLNLWSVINTKMAVNAAAREAVHAAEEAVPPTDPVGYASDAAKAALSTYYGRPPDDAHLEVEVRLPEGFRRCGRVDVTVTYRAPLIALPFLGSRGPDRDVVARHRGIVDPYRDSAPAAGSSREATGPCS